MLTAFLNTDPKLTEWFRRDFPEVPVCCHTKAAMLDADNILICACFVLEDEAYQAYSMWQRYLAVKTEAKKLIILGWRNDFQMTNYCSIDQLAEEGLDFIQAARPAGEEPEYPDLAFKDITLPLGRFLHSHGARAFQKLLIKVRAQLEAVEEIWQKDQTHMAHAPEMDAAIDGMTEIQEVWQHRQPYYSLMPDYQDLQVFDEIWRDWVDFQAHFMSREPNFCERIGLYLDEVVSEITDFYDMES